MLSQYLSPVKTAAKLASRESSMSLSSAAQVIDVAAPAINLPVTSVLYNPRATDEVKQQADLRAFVHNRETVYGDASKNPFAPHSVKKMHADVNKLKALRAAQEQINATKNPFAPHSAQKMHEDLNKLETLRAAQESVNDTVAMAQLAVGLHVTDAKALHADMAKVQAILEAQEPAAAPANPFAPPSTAALHADVQFLQTNEAAQAPRSAGEAFLADIMRVQEIQAQQEPAAAPANPFAIPNISLLHADCARVQQMS